jgi:lycopene beta-cyclase
MDSPTPDLVLVGGGLANSLIAWRLTEQRPDVRVLVLEAGDRLGGNHTWSFHQEDLTPAQLEWMEPFIVHRWDGQHIRFPDLRRDFSEPYLSITSDRLHDVMVAADRFELKSGIRVEELASNHVVTDAGERIEAGAVIDGRGVRRSPGMVLGFQKFIGREVRLAEAHGLTVPTIMDATVDQHDGYRFIYLLPFNDDTLLIEDTRYSDGEALDPDELHAAIDRYAASRGWTVTGLLRDEDGVLPILMAWDFQRFWPVNDPVARSGLRAGLFQPTTGYSLPQAVALADAIAQRWPMDGVQLARFTRTFTIGFCRRTAFYRLLNRMLFRVGRPEHRYRVLQIFYGLPESLITNFYATKLTLRQKIRILGNKPLPILSALPMVGERRFLEREAQSAKRRRSLTLDD